MKKGTLVLMRAFTLTARGFSTFTIAPAADYSRHISTPDALMRRSWTRTGEMLGDAIERVGGAYHGKVAARG